MPTTSLEMSWEVHDNWTEILAGTYFLITGPLEEESMKILLNIIARSIIINSHQLVEVMFFNVICKYIDINRSKISDNIINEIKDNIKKHIGIKEAMRTWPCYLIGLPFEISKEPFQSQEKLRTLRNESIHWPSGNSVKDLAHSAYYTGVQASEKIYRHFLKWEDSRYAEFIKKYQPSTDTYLVRTMQIIYKDSNHKIKVDEACP
jgi:hypothetical protein